VGSAGFLTVFAPLATVAHVESGAHVLEVVEGAAVLCGYHTLDFQDVVGLVGRLCHRSGAAGCQQQIDAINKLFHNFLVFPDLTHYFSLQRYEDFLIKKIPPPLVFNGF